MGVLIEVPPAHPELTVTQNLHIAALLHGAGPERVRTAVETWRLTAIAARRFRRRSLGNRQRVGLAAATQHDPALTVSDEPGDPRAERAMAAFQVCVSTGTSAGIALGGVLPQFAGRPWAG